MNRVPVGRCLKNRIQSSYIFPLVLLLVLLESFLYPLATADNACGADPYASAFAGGEGTVSFVTALPKMQKADVPEVISHSALRVSPVHVVYTGNAKIKNVIGRFYGGLLLIFMAIVIKTLTAVIWSVFFRKKEYLIKILTFIHDLDGKKRLL